MVKKLRIFLFTAICILLFSSLAESACSGSSPTWTAADTTYTEVANCITASSNGDTINVPLGSSTWSSNVVVNKQVAIIGNGIGNTVITGKGFSITNGTNNWRISGFTFDSNWSTGNPSIFVSSTAINGVKDFRIDHNKFINFPYSTSSQLMFYGYSYGLIDHNQFLNSCGETIGYCADNTAAFSRAGVGGYTNGTIFIEDNTFNYTNAGTGAGKCEDNPQNIYDSQAGARFVFRYNTEEDDTQLRLAIALEQHGFESSCSQPTPEARGTFSTEVYNNTFTSHGYNNDNRSIKMRGGRAIVYNNTFIGTWQPMLLTNYRSYITDPGGSVVKATVNADGYTYHAHTQLGDEGGLTCEHCSSHTGLILDQVQDTYIWNNTGLTVQVDPSCDYCSNDIIQNTHYWLSALGGYAPYTYPHPLQGCTPSKSVFTGQPTGGPAGVVWTTQPTVKIEDVNSNVCNNATNSTTLAIGTNPGSGTLICDTNPLTPTSGVLSFTGCKIDNDGTGYTLTASSTGLTGDTSSSFDITTPPSSRTPVSRTPVSRSQVNRSQVTR